MHDDYYTVPRRHTLRLIQRFYLRTAQQLRLLNIGLKTSLYLQAMEAVASLVTTRASLEISIYGKSMKLLDSSQQPNYLLYYVQRWLEFAVNIVTMLLVVIIIVLVNTLREKVGSGFAGIALSNNLAFSATMQATINSRIQPEISFGAVARIMSFSLQMESEDDEALESLAADGRNTQLVEPNLSTLGSNITSRIILSQSLRKLASWMEPFYSTPIHNGVKMTKPS